MLPTLYEYYTADGLKSGLKAEGTCFTLNDKIIILYSGAMHYFRVHPNYWQDRLRKFRAAGLNTVETYVPWNLHEPKPGVFDFGDGGSDFHEFLDIEKFCKIAQQEDLFVIVRPGPYICAEWDFGGLPSWLLRHQKMNIRTTDDTFLNYVSLYFTQLFVILSKLQFTNGGPIIAFQIENEYGNTKKEGENIDTGYLERLKEMFTQNGLTELYFTSDTPSNGNWGSLPDVLNTANFQKNPEGELYLLQKYQPNKPLMVMEYWTGWFDHWTENHHKRCNEEFSDVLEKILKFPASVNMYMFHGGTNWGFLNGGNIEDDSIDNAGYKPDTSSYDYDAPLNEAGDYTEKFFSVQRIIKKYNPILTLLPTLPLLKERIAYDKIQIYEELTFDNLLKNQELYIQSRELFSMELLPISENMGQSYGYIVYRKQNLEIPTNSLLMIRGRVCDTVLVLINGKIVSRVLECTADLNGFGYWKMKDACLELNNIALENATLDLVVENWGRVNYGKLDQFLQYKGIWQGHIVLNDHYLFDWEIFPLDFQKQWTVNLKGWQLPTFQVGPALYKGVLNVIDKKDTYIDMRAWTKGIVIVNGRELFSMELLPISENMGQSYGYIVYRKQNLEIPTNSLLMIRGRVCDTVLVLINGKIVSRVLECTADLNGFGYWKMKDACLELNNIALENATLDLVVENWGRVNYGKLDQFLQYKGIWQGHIVLNDHYLFDWEIFPLDFQKQWTVNLKGWQLPTFQVGPALYKGVLNVVDKKDTYIDMRAWTKGIVIVNGFVLSRYLNLGPQLAVYLPAPFLREGENDILIFEHFIPGSSISFVKDQLYKNID
ncbi:hypothetical protein FQA39_LY00756 [Lamprigera yunnana]|nr:hypothetical protein FQA39_LY00756 [Lamprigera yunnana]